MKGDNQLHREMVQRRSLKMVAVQIFVVPGLVMVVNHCAKVGMPGGGPEDKTPPRIVGVVPAERSLRVDPWQPILISFSERMQVQSVTSNLLIVPAPKLPPKISWKKRSLIIQPTEPWHTNRTYTLTITSLATDERGNRLPNSATITFATGDRLDSGSVSGTVYSGWLPAEGVGVWLYHLIDTTELNPILIKPDYETFTGRGGTFQFSGLGDGIYRIFAVKDLNRDNLWNPDREPIGIARMDIVLDSLKRRLDSESLFLVQQDTTRFGLRHCWNLGPQIIRLEFSQPLHFRTIIDAGFFSVSDIARQELIRVRSVFTTTEISRTLFLLVDSLTSGRRYEVKVRDLHDENGKNLEPSSLSGQLTVLPEPSPEFQSVRTVPVPNENYFFATAPPEIIFNFPVQQFDSDSAFLLLDSIGQPARGAFVQKTPVSIAFAADNKVLQDGMDYRLRIDEKKISDIYGRRLGDSIRVIRFRTIAEESLGTVSGQVVAQASYQNTMAILQFIGLIGPQKIKSITTGIDSVYQVALLPGKYLLIASLDLNQNGHWDSGDGYRFAFSEPQIIYPDTVYVRARFETEQIKLEFK